MKITLINADDSMGVDGLFFLGLDFSNVPDEVNAVHWNNGSGIIEYLNSTQKPDETITEMPSWMVGIKAQWDEAKAKKDITDAEFARQLKEHEELAVRIAEEAKKQQLLMQQSQQNEFVVPSLPTVS